MIIDARSREDGTTIDVELCVVGAGVAGLAVVLPLLAGGRAVAVVEAGGPEPEALPVAGRARGRLLGRRNRYLQAAFQGGFATVGGSHHAGVRPLAPLDLAPRGWVAGSGWPLAASELAPFVARAATVLGAAEPPAADPPSVLPAAASSFAAEWLPFVDAAAVASRLRPRFADAAGVEVLLHATPVALDLDRGGERVRELVARRADGATLRVRARHFVLAAGAVESARLLLLSDRRTPGGLGNARDQVGRGLRDQVVLQAGPVVLPGAGPLAAAWDAAGRHGDGAGLARAVLAPTAALQERHELLGSLITLARAPLDRGAALAPQVAGLARSVAALAGVALPRDHHLAAVTIRGEQAADPRSRLRLRDAVDSFGRRHVDLRWELGEHDAWSLRATARLLGEALGRHHAGRLQFRGAALRRRLRWAGHPSGTARMSRDPAAGVVDLDGRLHEVENVFVTGAAVFPTGGCSGLALTEVALGLRLGEHLRSLLERA